MVIRKNGAGVAAYWLGRGGSVCPPLGLRADTSVCPYAENEVMAGFLFIIPPMRLLLIGARCLSNRLCRDVACNVSTVNLQQPSIVCY